MKENTGFEKRSEGDLFFEVPIVFGVKICHIFSNGF